MIEGYVQLLQDNKWKYSFLVTYCHFPIGILGQVWYLIVSIPDLCNLITLIITVVLSVLRGGPKKSPRTFI